MEGTAASLRHFSKSFAGKTVLSDVDMDIQRGEVHGLLGQNGSGKSTIIKILAGFHAPDDGASLRLDGTPVSLTGIAVDHHRHGMAFVHQELGLADSMTVLENFRAARYETGRFWRIRWKRERREVRASLARFGVDVDPDVLMGSLRPVEKALIAIGRAFHQIREAKGGLLVLDEPTAYLPRDGVERLFAGIKSAASSGLGVLLVTHRLDEVRTITDRVTVLRNGRVAGQGVTAKMSENDLIELILGRALGQLYPEAVVGQGEPAAVVENLSGPTVRGFSTTIHEREIVGLTGLLGMGHDEVLYLLFGAVAAEGGSMKLSDRSFDLVDLKPHEAIEAGLALLPGNRLVDGAEGSASITDNVTLATLGNYFVGGRLRARRENKAVRTLLTDFAVVPPEPNRIFATLSGGNQQKALLGKWFATEPRLMLLHEPTQGVDVGARRQIFQLARDAADAGVAVVMASTEYEDLANLCDRVLVFRDGVVTSELHGSSLTAERIVEQCFTVAA